jgi:hypothetical protein
MVDGLGFLVVLDRYPTKSFLFSKKGSSYLGSGLVRHQVIAVRPVAATSSLGR